MTSATLAGHRVTHARVNLPAWGLWYADVSTDGEHALSGAVDLVVNDLTLRGAVLSGGPSAGKGRSSFRIVAGKGGWGKTLAKKSYASDAGVKVATVVGDAAREAGETFDAATAPATLRVGPGWTRPDGPASRVLEQVAPSAWYVGEDGATRLGRRAATTYADPAPRAETADRARGCVTLAAEKIAALVPGVVVDGLEAVDVVHDVSPKGGLRSTIYGKVGGASTSRTLDAFRKILDQLDPDRPFRAVWEYRVVTLEGKRVNLQSVLVSTGMPDLRRVPVRPGVAGADATLKLGSRVLVAFVNADPARPAIVGFEDADGEGFAPDALALCGGNVVDATGIGRVVRYGDPIVFATPGPGFVSAGAVLNHFSKVSA